MKKFILVIVVLTLFSFINVYALEEVDLKNKIKDTIFVKYESDLDKYLEKYDLSEKDIKYIAGQIDYLKKVSNKNKVKSISEFEKNYSAEIIAVTNNISDSTGVNLKVLSSGKLEVSKYNSKDRYMIVNTNIVKDNGSDILFFVALGITIIGGILLVFRVRKA